VLSTWAGADPKILVDLLQRRDPATLRWIEEAGSMLRQAIVSVENFLDPEVVFIGGTVPQRILDALVDIVEPLPSRVSYAKQSGTPRLLESESGAWTRNAGGRSPPDVRGNSLGYFPAAQEQGSRNPGAGVTRLGKRPRLPAGPIISTTAPLPAAEESIKRRMPRGAERSRVAYLLEGLHDPAMAG